MSGIKEIPESLRVWDLQIRIFAKHFLAHAQLPTQSFSLLDVGCGTGSAADEISKRYPHAALFGSDIMQEHIDICKKLHHSSAQFFVSDFEHITDDYDIIYISNVLEHVPQYEQAVQHVLKHCSRLYILVPYNEPIEKKIKSNIQYVDHVNSFSKASFAFLDQHSYSIESRILRTPGAWGHTLRREVGLRMQAFAARSDFEVQREILFAITHNKPSAHIPKNPFFNSIHSAIKTFAARNEIQK